MKKSVKVVSLLSVIVSALVTITLSATPASAEPERDWKPKYEYENNDGVSQIYTFGEHTCGVQDNVMWCWGSNSNWRIGRYLRYGSLINFTRSVPRILGYIDLASSISVETAANFQVCSTSTRNTACPSGGFQHDPSKGIVAMGGLYTTCMIQGSSPSATSGELYCMGYNVKGQAGTGSLSTQVDQYGVEVPTKVVTGDGFANTAVTEVDGGVDFSCAVEGGSVYCWGNDEKGQLGDATVSQSSLTPKKVDSVPQEFQNTSVSGLSSGFNHSCAIEGGKAYCWGNNTDAVGVGYTEMWGPSNTPAYPPLVYTGGEGRTGTASGTSTLVPAPVQAGDGFTNTGVTQVSAGYRHTCAIQSGSVYCWGNNSSGQLGDGSTTQSSAPRMVLAASGFTNTNVTKVMAGDHHTCALEGGSVYCWGDQQLGRLGDLSYLLPVAASSPQSTPVKVADGAMGNSDITDLSIGSGAHTCVVKGGKAYCWGPGKRWGTLSDGSVTNEIWSGVSDISAFRTDAPQPRLVNWGPSLEPDPNVPATPPSAPLNVVATPGWQTVTVKWDKPVSEGTYPITNYLAQATPGGQVCITRLTDADLQSCTFTRLTPGVKYTFKVQGLNGGGWGTRSEASNVATPYELKIIGYGREALPILLGNGSDVSAKGTAYGYPPNTKITPYVKVGDTGQWEKLKTISSDAAGKFSIKYRFGKKRNGTPVWVQFAVNGDRSNSVTVPPVGTSRRLLSIQSAFTDLGGMPEPTAPNTDIQFGFAEGRSAGDGLPIQLHGMNLKPGSSVTAELVKLVGNNLGTTVLWSSPAKAIAPAVQGITGTANTAIAATAAFTATGFTPTTFAASGLPAGLSIDATTGVISGTPTAASTAAVTVTASAGADSATAKVYFNIAGSTSVSPAMQVVTVTTGTPVSTSALSPTGVSGDVTYAVHNGTLPEGLTLDTATGEVTGVPTVSANDRVVIRATGATSGTADAVIAFSVTFTDSSAIADENGDVFASFNLPSWLARGSWPSSAGEYKVVFRGVAPDGTTVEQTNYFSLADGVYSEITPDTSVLTVTDPTRKPYGPVARAITAVAPSRLVDTRDASIVEAGGVLKVQVTGRGGVPAGASTAMLNVTATGHEGNNGYLTVYACENTRRETSNLNIDNGGTVANAVTVELGASGEVCIYSRNKTHIVVDVTGYAAMTSTLNYSSMTPTRIIDTRQVSSATKRLTAGQTVELSMPAGVPASAEAVALNITLDVTDDWGWASVYPCGQAWQNTSTVNALAGQTAAGSALALLGTGDKVCVYTSVGTDLIVDVFGWYSPAAPASLQSHEATRVIDTRRGSKVKEIVENDVTIIEFEDDAYELLGTVAADSVSSVQVDMGYFGEASAVVANLTVTLAEGDGYLTVFDCRTSMPVVSSLNFKRGETRANQIVIPTTTDSLCVYNSAPAHFIIDLVGRYVEGYPQVG